MSKLLKNTLKKARHSGVRILFPETFDNRTLIALATIMNQQLCQPILIGEKLTLQKQINKLKLKIDLKNCHIISQKDQDLQKKLAQKLFQLRQKKGLTLAQAKSLIRTDLNYFANTCLAAGLADGIVGGATTSTGSTLKPAFQIIGTAKTHRLASGVFLMDIPHREPLLFADCAINIRPTANELADIAINTAETAQFLGLKPKVALLSFSSHGSSHHPEAKLIAQATRIAQRRAPHLLIDGELQADSALVPHIANFKAPRATIQGDANVLIFPSLEAGNIAYKLVERLAGANAIGTIVQGLKKPVNDLSRGCQPSDIVYLTAITALQITKK